jgi:predicted DNA-binding helix-hairpin-helix protein
MDPKASWALRHLERFPIEVNKASLEELLRIPGVGEVSARRILRQRRVASVKAEDLKRMGVVMKRAKYFLTCQGKYYGGKDLVEDTIRGQILMEEKLRYRLTGGEDQQQLSLFSGSNNWLPEPNERGREGQLWPVISMTEASKGS